MKRWPVILLQSLSVLLVTEVILRLTGKYSLYSERIGRGAVSYYGENKPSWFHHWTPGHPYSLVQPEFNYSYNANSLGLRGEEWTEKRPEDHCRLIILGDSFTEGDGAPTGMEFPSQLADALLLKRSYWQVYNAGVCGSDPFFNAMFFRHRLPRFEYDAVIFLVNASDFDDFIFRGGMERFRADSTTVFRKGPWWLRPYLASHLFRGLTRMVTDIDPELLVSPVERVALNRLAVTCLTEMFAEVYSECMLMEKRMLIILHPLPWELSKGIVNNDLSALGDHLVNEGVPVLDLRQALADSTSGMPLDEYAWPVNGHFNARGYRMLANTVLKQTDARDADFFRGRCPTYGSVLKTE